MKNLSLITCLLFTVFSFSQDNPVTVTEITEDSDEIPFSIIEKVPVYSGCDVNMGNQAIKECMSSQIATLINKNFNTKLANSLNLPAGKVRILVQFKIDKQGKVIDVRARAPHSELENEAIRVINLIPKMQKPGMQKGRPVIVPYGLPIVFIVEDTKPLSEKEQRKLNKKNRS